MPPSPRSYLGTPFHFGGRLKGVGLDCGGLLICLAEEAGLKIDVPPYTRETAARTIVQILETHCAKVDLADLQPGDILFFRHRRLQGHLGIATGEGTFIHAHDSPSVRAVVETPLDEAWLARLESLHRPTR